MKNNEGNNFFGIIIKIIIGIAIAIGLVYLYLALTR